MTALPDWMRPPREEGWSADDLDHLPEAPRRTELIDGGGVVGQEEDRVGDLPQLDDASGRSYDARAELIDIGPDAIPALIGGLPSLGGLGQLTAIEVFEEVADPRCGPALIALLGSDGSTVREWAAMALASLKIDGAVEPVRRAYRACLERATPPDWTESVGIRWALTELGARTPVVPPHTARLRASAADDVPGWPSAHFTEIIDDLADHAQVILYSQFWRVDTGRTYGVPGPGLDWELDWIDRTNLHPER